MDEEIREAVERAKTPHHHEAIILTTPGSHDVGVRVRIPGFDQDGYQGKTVFGPAPWMQRWEPGSCGGDCGGCCLPLFPQAGDYALVVVSDEGNAWVQAWWPSEYRRPLDRHEDEVEA